MVVNFSEVAIEVEEEVGEEGTATEEVTMVTVTMEGESWVKVLTDQTTGTLMTTGVILATDVTDIIPMVIEDTGVKVTIRVKVVINGIMIQTDEKKWLLQWWYLSMDIYQCVTLQRKDIGVAV